MLKNQVLKLRSEGKTYNEIVKIIGCSKGTVSYYCGQNQKEKTKLRQRKNRSKRHPFQAKLYNFKYRKIIKPKTKNRVIKKYIKLLQVKIAAFHFNRSIKVYENQTFNVQDVIDKFGEHPKCYLTGEPIDIDKPRTYEFDHKIPRSRGGDNSLDNLGICTKQANRAKGDMTPDEFINFCKMVIEYKSC